MKRSGLSRNGGLTTSTRINARCEVCGAKFHRARSQVEHRGPARFCSRACQIEGTKTRERRPCEICGTEFVVQRVDPKRGRYCSRECYDKANKPQKLTCTCSVCGKTFETWPAWMRNGRAKTCSKECASRARYKGTEHGRGVGWKKLSAEIRVADENQCVRCGTEPDARELSVDHVIPWRMWVNKVAANDRRNLRSLCDRCHGIKSSSVEPKLEKGQWLALKTFYGDEVAESAMALFFESQ